MALENVLVTGGAGFIGSNIVEGLLKAGYSVTVLDDFSTGKKENIREFEKDIQLIEGDIRNFDTVQKAVKGINIVLHQAALPSVPRSINDPITTNAVNVTGFLNVLQASKENKVRKIVFASSSSIYGDNPTLPKHEDMDLNPMSPYAVSKLAGEKYLSVFSRLFGIETLALRYFNVFGPKQDPNSLYSAVIPKFISAIQKGESPVIYGDGEQSRDFTYVANVVKANILAITTVCESGLSMNCACHEQISLNSLLKSINKIMGKNIEPIYQEARVGDVRHSYASIERIKNTLKYVPLIGFEQGLHYTIQWLSR